MYYLPLLISCLLCMHIACAIPQNKRQTLKPGSCTKNKRKAWHTLSNADKTAYINAEVCLERAKPVMFSWATNLYDELRWLHIVNTNTVHYTGSFLPWHRLYVSLHEYLLQTICHYAGAQPYWDEARDVDNMSQAEIFDPDTGFGGDGQGRSNCVQDGPFSNLTLHVNLKSKHSRYCLSRDFNPDIFQGSSSNSVSSCLSKPSYVTAFDCIQQGPHSAGHDGVGGTMGDPAMSAGDPIFFLHHANIDRIWWQWQLKDLNNRLTDMGGPNVPVDWYIQDNDLQYPGPSILNYNGDNGPTTTLNHVLWMVGMVPNATIREVMDLRGNVICADYV